MEVDDCVIEEHQPCKENKLPTKAGLMVKTISLIALWFLMGMTQVLTPTTLPDIRERLETNTAELSTAFAIGSLGAMFGAPLGSIADRYHNKVDMILSISLFALAFLIGTKCLFANLIYFTINCFLEGVAWTCINAVGNSVVMDLWGEEASAPMHALHFGYPLGAMVGPLIAYPFVSTSPEPENITSNTTDLTTSVVTSDKRYNDNSQIEVAFGIAAFLLALLAIIFITFQFVLPSHKISSHHNKVGFNWKKVFSPSEWANGDKKFGIVIIVLMMLFYFLHLATLKTSSTFYVTFAVDEMEYDNREASLLSSAMFFAGTCGRGIAIVLAKFIPIQAMLLCEVHGQAIAGIAILILGLRNKKSYLICGCIFTFFREPVWPSGYTWTDQYIFLYAVVVGFIDLAAQFSDFSFNLILGYLYEYTIPESLFYTTVLAGICHCILNIIMTIIAEKHGRRFMKGKHSIEENSIPNQETPIDTKL